MKPCDAMEILNVGDLRNSMHDLPDAMPIATDIEIVARVGNVYLPLDIVSIRTLIVSTDLHGKPWLTMVVDAASFNKHVRLASP